MATNFDDSSSVYNFVVRDGNGVKGMVDLGLSKVPQAFMQPPEERIDKPYATLHSQPPIDLSRLNGPDHDQVVKEIVKACETLGFFQVVNHGVPVELLESLKNTANNFFSLPFERKVVYHPRSASSSPLAKYGTSFVPDKEETLEWKDYMQLDYTNDAEALEHWPIECRDVVLEFMRTSVNMVLRKLLVVLMGNLGMKPDDPKIDALTDKKMVVLNYYPTCPNPDLAVGIGRHSDIGTLTVLLQDEIGGLQVKIEDDIDHVGNKGDWIEIPPMAGALVINVGDTLQVLSNGRYRSAEHRVRTTSTKSRVSMPVFTFPKRTEKIAPLPHLVEKDGIALYREFVFADYLEYVFASGHHGKTKLDFVKMTSA